MTLLSTKARKHHSNKLRLDNWLRRFEVHPPRGLKLVSRSTIDVGCGKKYEFYLIDSILLVHVIFYQWRRCPGISVKLLSTAAQASLKLNSMRRGITARSSGSSKKSMSIQPVTLGPEMVTPFSPFTFPVRALINQCPNLLFTPSTPNPAWGQPKPRATVVGKARGNDAAEKKDIAKVGGIGPSFGVTKIFVASSTFSGMDKNEGISYLGRVERMCKYGRFSAYQS